MSTTPSPLHRTRVSGFAAASLWHGRMAKTGSHFNFTKVHPRLCAELVLHPIPRIRGVSSGFDTRKDSDVFHAA